ncbi:hypothetical protein FA13DRAFT_203395 [Coprinellus micaceus]|uniref:Uncharacterized protein n=1 Tax=Coprinellus micaceus TaxID=71717 RepID=A0A4Y7SG45_COPMI|nr:hypothetical protein FA13DRAFT_203395 [Coprinellus micaceus]
MDSNHPPVVTPPQVVAPAQTLLPEVLGEIFESIVAKGLEKGRLNEAKREKLIQLMLVCKWWREVALLTRRLWGGVGLKGRSHSLIRRPFKRLELWFERAGNTRKSLTVKWRGVPSPKSPWCPRHPESD